MGCAPSKSGELHILSQYTGSGTERIPGRSSWPVRRQSPQIPIHNVVPQGRTETSCGNMATDDRTLPAPHRSHGYEILPNSQRDLAKRQTSLHLILPNDFKYDPSSGKVVKQEETSCGNMATDDRTLPAPHRSQGYEILPISQRDLATRQTSVPLILPNDFQYDSSSGKVVKQEGEKRTKLVLVEEALMLLRDVTDPVSVLGICGPARSGKSYVLSRMIGAHDAFELGNEMNPQTFGIWMGTKVLRNREKGFVTILIDSEGTGAFDADSTNDVGILVMTVLLTSQLIYNTKNVPQKKDLDELKALTDVTGKIRAKENEEVTEDMGALRRVFPNFTWLLRDVYLKFSHPVTGDEMSPTDYVKEVVFRRESQEKKETDQEKTGRLILMAFERVEAFALPSPGDEDLLTDIAANAGAIKPKFNKKMEEFIEGILSGLECKRGMTVGSKITGDQLATMLQQYVKAVNDPDTIPAIKSAWDASVELRCTKILEDMVSKYNTEMTEAINKACLGESEMLPIEERDDDPKKASLMRTHDAVMDNVCNELKRQIEFFGADGDRQDSNDELFFVLKARIVQRQTNENQEYDDITGGELQRYLQENRDRSRRYCEKVFKELLDGLKQRLSPIPDGYTGEKLKSDLDRLKESYLQQAIGPMKLTMLQERWESSDMTGFFEMCKEIRRLKMEEVEAKRQRDILELKEKENQRKLQEAQEEHEREMKEQAKAMERVIEINQENIEKMQRSWEAEKSNLEKKMEDLKKAGQEEKMEMMKDFSRKFEERAKMADMEHQKEMLIEKLKHQQELAAADKKTEKMRNRGVWNTLWNYDPN